MLRQIGDGTITVEEAAPRPQKLPVSATWDGVTYAWVSYGLVTRDQAEELRRSVRIPPAREPVWVPGGPGE